MPMMEYGSLSSIIKYSYPSGIKDDKSIAIIASKTLKAIDFLHSKDIIHRDIKPGNILINNEGNVMLGDLGIATKFKGENIVGISGSIDYIPPEIFSNNGYNKKFDIWSLGMTMVEMVNGSSPYCGMNKNEVFKNIYNFKSPNIKYENKHNPVLIELIKNCLCKDPLKRLSSKDLLNKYKDFFNDFDNYDSCNYIKNNFLLNVPIISKRVSIV